MANSFFSRRHALCRELKSKPMETLRPQFTRREGGRLVVRKQVYELTLRDLQTFPVWEFRVDEAEEDQDESTVQPHIVPGPLDPADRMFIVRTIFTLADGSKMCGYCAPPGRDDVSIG